MLGATSLLFVLICVLDRQFDWVFWIAVGVLAVSITLATNRTAPLIAGLLLIAIRAGVGLFFFPTTALVVVLAFSVAGAFFLLRPWRQP